MMEQVNVALLGFGTVGQGTFELLVKNNELIANRTGIAIKVTKIFVRNIDKYSHITLPEGTHFKSLLKLWEASLLHANALKKH